MLWVRPKRKGCGAKETEREGDMKGRRNGQRSQEGQETTEEQQVWEAQKHLHLLFGSWELDMGIGPNSVEGEADLEVGLRRHAQQGGGAG